MVLGSRWEGLVMSFAPLRLLVLGLLLLAACSSDTAAVRAEEADAVVVEASRASTEAGREVILIDRGHDATPEAATGAIEATVTVTFSGDACTYTGASTFDADTALTVKVVNGTERRIFGFSVWKVPDGTTLADIDAEGMLKVGGDRSENMRGILRPGSVESRELMVVLDEAGTWGMDCFTLAAGTVATDEAYAAVVFEVA
jgi:hypothetical protein